jgi:hypothetical protein
MPHELFTNVISLHEEISVYPAQRSPVEGFPTILAFCVYILWIFSIALVEMP